MKNYTLQDGLSLEDLQPRVGCRISQSANAIHLFNDSAESGVIAQLPLDCPNIHNAHGILIQIRIEAQVVSGDFQFLAIDSNGDRLFPKTVAQMEFGRTVYSLILARAAFPISIQINQRRVQRPGHLVIYDITSGPLDTESKDPEQLLGDLALKLVGNYSPSLKEALIARTGQLPTPHRVAGFVYEVPASIQHFLSLYQLNAREINCVLYIDKPETHAFLTALLPNDLLFPIPFLSATITIADRIDNQMHELSEIVTFRKRVESILDGLDPQIPFFAPSYDRVIGHIILGEAIKRNGHTLECSNVAPESIVSPERREVLAGSRDPDDKRRRFTAALQRAVGTELIHTHAAKGSKNAPRFIKRTPPEHSDRPVVPWPELLEQFQMPRLETHSQSILFIDKAFQVVGEFDLKRMVQELDGLFEILLDRGYEIHLKPHPLLPNETCLSESRFFDQFQLLDGVIPIELLLQNYPITLSFGSTSLSVPVPGKKYVLFSYIHPLSSRASDRLHHWKQMCSRFPGVSELTAETIDLAFREVAR